MFSSHYLYFLILYLPPFHSFSFVSFLFCCHLKLLMMKHSSVFINDAKEAGRLINEMPSKGSIYGAFRYDSNVPDMLGAFVISSLFFPQFFPLVFLLSPFFFCFLVNLFFYHMKLISLFVFLIFFCFQPVTGTPGLSGERPWVPRCPTLK